MARLSALEAREPDEAKHVVEMIDILRRRMARDYVAGHTLRDAHPKTTGVLRGKFVVVAGLPDELRVGVFAKARSFDCWIRTSNASGTPRSDANRAALWSSSVVRFEHSVLNLQAARGPWRARRWGGRRG